MAKDKEKYKDLEQLILLCKRKGIKSIKYQGIEFELMPYVVKEDGRGKKKPKLEQTMQSIQSDIVPVELPFTEEDALLWSAPTIG